VAGIALLREQKVEALASDDGGTVPEGLILEASLLHPYAVASYTVLVFFSLYMSLPF